VKRNRHAERLVMTDKRNSHGNCARYISHVMIKELGETKGCEMKQLYAGLVSSEGVAIRPVRIVFVDRVRDQHRSLNRVPGS
jgi:hypothetical protein